MLRSRHLYAASRSHARAVVIGGGVGGCAILYWLTRLGWTDTSWSSGRAHQRLDLSLGRAGRPAARLAQPDADDDELGRALPDARRRGRPRDRLARGRLAAPGVFARSGMEELARQAGWAKTFGLPLELDLGRRGAAAVPADVDRRRARRRLPADRRLHRPEPADLRPRRRRAPARRRDLRRTRASPRSTSTAAGSPVSSPTGARSRPRSWSTPAASSRARSAGSPA